MDGTDRALTTWRKSSYSGGNGGNCVEVRSGPAVMVRDTQNRAGAMLAFSLDAWRRFAATIKNADKA
jgi:hypothetical protein